MLINQLMDSKKQGVYASVYSNLANPEGFTFGKILYCDDDFFVVQGHKRTPLPGTPAAGILLFMGTDYPSPP